MKEIQVDVPAPVDLGYDVISVPQGSGVDLDLKLEAARRVRPMPESDRG